MNESINQYEFILQINAIRYVGELLCWRYKK